MIRFSLFGIPVEIQPFFWVTLAIIGGALGASSPVAILYVSLFVLAGAISVLVHELGHALTIRAFGAPSQIVLYAFGGYAAYPAGIFDRRRQFLISAAGPALQILLGALALCVRLFVNLPTDPSKVFFEALAGISIFWAVLNLVPVIPPDGGQMMAAILGNQRRSTALRISIAAALGCGLLAYVLFHTWLFPIFLGMFAYRNFQELRSFR